MQRSSIPAFLRTAFVLVLAMVFLYLVTVQAEAMNPWMESTFAKGVYRVTFFVRLPAAVMGSFFFPLDASHHWPRGLTIFSCVGAPLFWYAVWRASHVALRIVSRAFLRPATESSMSRESELSRRVFLGRMAMGAGIVVPGGTGTYGVLLEPQDLQVRRYTIPITDLPPSLSGLRIAHVSDLHYGPCITLQYLRRALGVVAELNPDFVILTGDYTQKTWKAIEPGIELLGALQPKYGMAAVLGNHDYWEGPDITVRAMERLSIPVLTNKSCFLTPEGLGERCVPGHSLCIAGIDDLWEGTPSIDKALAGVPPEVPRLVLSHNPDCAEHAPPGIRVDLMCSGHTHGGQVQFPLVGAPIVPSAFGQKYVGGLCTGPRFPVLVSRGVGMAMFPVRLGV
ncbi:MAG: metallophosphoesterase, partial [Candidatus Hydrogenedentes bacterium]|nr:metallophosphoesterase [Candidatus Hydrogenedentota bacterium]